MFRDDDEAAAALAADLRRELADVEAEVHALRSRRARLRATRIARAAACVLAALALAGLVVRSVRSGEPVRPHEYLRHELMPDAGGGDAERCAALEAPSCERAAAASSDETAAYQLHRRACLLGLSDACVPLAERMASGPRAMSAALFFFDLCVRKQHPAACARMKELCAAKRLPITVCLTAEPPPR